MLARLGWAGRVALDLLLPPHCAACDVPVQAHGQLCAACFGQISFITEPCCARCGLPFAHKGEAGPGGECAACLANPPPWGRARAALAYDEASRRLVLPLKYADRTDLAAALAPHMARAGAVLLAEAEVLVPVPLHRRRLLSRRYNQAVLLARALSGQSGVALLPDALVRLRATPQLASLSAAERGRVVQGAFAVRAGRVAAIAGRRVLLIDDLLTSGATSAACVRVLLDAGAAGVDVLVAARVPDPRHA
jgi:ComF family protein